MRLLLPVTTQKPNETRNAIHEGLSYLKLGGASPTLRAWELDVSQTPITVKARVLNPPTLEFRE